MSDVLDADDADRMRNFAANCDRVVRTARRIAPANADHLNWRLLMLADQAERAASTARDIAKLVDPEGEDEGE